MLKTLNWFSFCFLFALLSFTGLGCMNDDVFDLIKQNKKLTKAEINLHTDNGLKKVVINDAVQLTKMNQALQNAQKIEVQKGGAFDFIADITIYKNNQSATFVVLHSPYHGWYIETDNNTLSSQYIFDLVTSYKK